MITDYKKDNVLFPRFLRLSNPLVTYIAYEDGITIFIGSLKQKNVVKVITQNHHNLDDMWNSYNRGILYANKFYQTWNSVRLYGTPKGKKGCGNRRKIKIGSQKRLNIVIAYDWMGRRLVCRDPAEKSRTIGRS